MGAQSDLCLQRVCRWGVRGRRWRRLDPSGSHVGEKLLWDLGQDILRQSSHAQDVISTPVNVIPEWYKLKQKRELVTSHDWEALYQTGTSAPVHI